MAKIYGVELKKVIEYKGHEDEPLIQCDIYMDGKKIGFYRDADYGGENEINICDSTQEKSLNTLSERLEADNILRGELVRRGDKYLSSPYSANEPYAELCKGDAEALIYPLLNLRDMEKMFTSGKKKGYKTLTCFTDKVPHTLLHVESIQDIEAKIKLAHPLATPDSFVHYTKKSDFDIIEKEFLVNPSKN